MPPNRYYYRTLKLILLLRSRESRVRQRTRRRIYRVVTKKKGTDLSPDLNISRITTIDCRERELLKEVSWSFRGRICSFFLSFPRGVLSRITCHNHKN